LNKNDVKPSKKGPPVNECIPCLYLPCEDGGNKLVLYFHGNAEDIGLAYDLMFMFGTEMKYHVLAVEYPGYGLYKTSKPDENMMREDADTVYDYLTQVVGIKEKDIILFGRSMGSGPTSYLSSRKRPASLLLMSPYMSIKDATKSLLGWASFLSVVVYERFKNVDAVANA
jgi:abhydrolase domain-containing protein 17